MLFDELQRLVSKGESQEVEFKKTTGQRSEAAKTVCAFLNGQGGFLIFGVADSGEIVGQQVNSKTIEDLNSELRRIEPPAFPEIETVALDGVRSLIVIRVPGRFGTYMYDHRPYLRYGPTTQVMPREEYEKRVLKMFHAQRRWENEKVPPWVAVDDLDQDTIRSVLDRAVYLGRMKRPPHTDILSLLRGLGLLYNDVMLNGAIALFGKSERLHSSFPQMMLRLARFRGHDRLGGFADHREYWGHAFDLLKRGEAFLLDHVPIAGQIVPGKMAREDTPAYPPLATREALANAICHRDYAIAGGSVGIALYDTHLEIINPGTFHFDITPQKLVFPHESKPWNPIIANVFYRAGIIEKWGMGTLNIVDQCKKNRNPSPRWEVRTQSVVALFFPSSLVKARPESRPESIESRVIRFLEKGPLSKAEIASNVGHKRVSGALKKTLSHLLESGRIVPTLPDRPNSRLQKYRISNPPSEE